jgi:hypothetical protein
MLEMLELSLPRSQIARWSAIYAPPSVYSTLVVDFILNNRSKYSFFSG